MKRLSLLFLVMISTAPAFDENAEWSQPDNGLVVRLFILPPLKSQPPFCRVFIEFKNIDEVMGQKNIRFAPGALRLRVADRSGKELPAARRSYNGMSPKWEPILLPYAGNMRFQVSFPGLGYRATDRAIVDIGFGQSWILPPDGSKYYLSGCLAIRRESGDHPRMVWHGTLLLPEIEIPK